MRWRRLHEDLGSHDYRPFSTLLRSRKKFIMKRFILCTVLAAVAAIMVPVGASAQMLSPTTIQTKLILAADVPNAPTAASATSDQTVTPMPTFKTLGQLRRLYGESPSTRSDLGQGVQPNSIGSRRYAVRNECWYAINQGWFSRGDDINGPGANGTLSNWNWLSKAADANANGLRYALNTYQTCVSNAIPPWCNCCPISTSMRAPQNSVEYWVNYLSANSYALGYGGSGAGHGAQCVSFVAMVIYRATGGAYKLKWSWGGMGEGSCPSAKYAQPGDIVFNGNHVSICVRNYGTGITIVDSNYLGPEVIGRHDLSNATIGTTWKVYSGSGRWY